MSWFRRKREAEAIKGSLGYFGLGKWWGRCRRSDRPSAPWEPGCRRAPSAAMRIGGTIAGLALVATLTATAGARQASEPEALCAATALPTAEAAAATEASDGNPIKGRLGGSLADFQARFGEGTEEDDPLEGHREFEFELPGCGTVDTEFVDGFLARVMVIPEGYDEGAFVPWDADAAERIANRLIPLDAQLEPYRGGLDHGYVLSPGYSAALAAAIPAELYARLDDTAVQGQYEAAYVLAGPGDPDVEYVSVKLWVDDPS